MASFMQLVCLVLWFDYSFATEPDDPMTYMREDTQVVRTPLRDSCLERFGGIELTYPLGSIQKYDFNLCDVVNCGAEPRRSTSTLWICDFGFKGAPRKLDPVRELVGQRCYEYEGGPQKECVPGKPDMEVGCVKNVWALLSSRPMEFANLKPIVENRLPYISIMQKSSSIARIPSTQLGAERPVTFTLGGILENPYEMTGLECGTESRDHFYYILATEILGEELKGLLKINLVREENTESEDVILPDQSLDRVTASITPGENKSEEDLPPEVILEEANITLSGETWRPIEGTGYIQQNLWVNVLVQTAKKLDISDCYMCTNARPILRMTATAFETSGRVREEGPEFLCLLEVMSQENLEEPCSYWDVVYPVTPEEVVPPVFSTEFIVKATCFASNIRDLGNYTDMGHLDEEYCRGVEDLSEDPIVAQLGIARADLWWYCGGSLLWGHLPPNWRGRCALISLVLPVHHFTMDNVETNVESTLKSFDRVKRSLENPLPQSQSLIYLDAIGIPRGIPDDYKLADPIANGFESILPWITTNKNVDRINVIYYGVQRLANCSRDGFEGTHGQLKATSLTAYQNRVALDMLLAEVGGVCFMFKDVCCTFIPNNTAPEGTLTKALEDLRMLSVDLKEKAGVDNSCEKWFLDWFGKWSSFMTKLVIGILISVSIFAILSCCCVPFIRTLILKCIDRAITPDEKLQIKPAYQFLAKVLGPEPINGNFLEDTPL